MKRRGSLVRTVFLIMVIMGVLVQVACTSNKPSSSSSPSASQEAKATDSAAAKPVTLKALTSKHPYQADWNTMLIFQEREKKTNVHIDWENISEDVWVEKRNLRLATKDLPDFLSRSMLTDAEVATYAKQGIIVPIQDLIEKDMPNLSAIFKADPTKKAAITNADGKIFGLPSFDEEGYNNINKLWINKVWLDKLGLPLPTTLDEYFNDLIAFRDKNPGGVDGPIGYTHWQNTFDQTIAYFAGSFGLGTKGTTFIYDGVDLGPDGKMRFMKTDPAFKEELQFLNKLWNEKLIDQDFLNHKSEVWTANSKAGRMGSFVHNNTDINPIANYEPLPPLQGSHGTAFFSHVLTGLNPNNTVITSANKNVDATLKWLDYWYSEEGLVEMQWGIKDKTYTVDANGGYWWTAPYDSDSGVPVEKSRGLFSPMFGYGLPFAIYKDELNKRPWKADKMKGGVDKLVSTDVALSKYAEPALKNGANAFAFTADELAAKQAFTKEGLQYVKEMETKFITGKAKFDEWDNYVKQVNSLGLDKYMKIYNDALDRFNKSK